ncbi:MAG: hypothetical protein JWN90_40 [Parcubacteria group bacterium]|nr:hypothetical protein [Parcubacteria group bacterium]
MYTTQDESVQIRTYESLHFIRPHLHTSGFPNDMPHTSESRTNLLADWDDVGTFMSLY